ncbi:NUDIX hydrolase [Kitasatospora indigofera]|uniref:NUDIX hydrolase n=1 Tax=Kitasatospora indigofera TaxID=67307 RepID=UPI0036C23E5C
MTVTFFDALALRLVRAPMPQVDHAARVAMDQFWERARSRQPALFDGPAVACLGIEQLQAGELCLTWARTSYRYRALRQVAGASWKPASMFVTVLQPVDGGGVIVGRSSGGTAHPGRWALPGGSVEPPAAGRPLDAAALRRHAVRELAEEVGLMVGPDEVATWTVTQGAHGNVGVHFLAPPVPAELVLKHHRGLTEAGRARGTVPELDRLAVVRSVDDVLELGEAVDFLAPVLARHAQGCC